MAIEHGAEMQNRNGVGITAFAVDADATTNAIFYTLDNKRATVCDQQLNRCCHGCRWIAVKLRTATSHGITVRATSADGFDKYSELYDFESDGTSSRLRVVDTDSDGNFVAENATAVRW